MLQEARARMVDVETGVEPGPMRTPADTTPTPSPEPPALRASPDRAVKRPSPKPARVAASRARPQPEAPTQEVPIPVSDPAPSPIAEPDPSEVTLGGDQLLWLEDQPGHTVAEPGDGSKEIIPWRRGLRG
jgi:hypothetical protein